MGFIANFITIINGLKFLSPILLPVLKKFPSLAKPHLKKFISYLGSENSWKRDSAIKILENIGEMAIPLLIEKIYKRKNSKITEGAIEVLDRIGIPAIQIVLREMIKLDSYPGKARQLHLMYTFWEEMTPNYEKINFLLRQSASNNFRIKKCAIIAIREAKLSETIGRLGEILLDVSNELVEIRKEAAGALGEIKHPGSKPNLIRSLSKDPDWEVRAAAAEALGNIGGSDLIDPLKNSTMDCDWRVIENAAEALGKIKASNNEIIKRLIELISHHQPQVRKAAICAIGEIGSTNTIQTLLSSFLGEETFEVIHCIGDALVEIDTGEALQQVDEIISMRSSDISDFKSDILSDTRYRIKKKITLRR